MFQKALFIFRRDLRLEDNTGLLFALNQAKTVIPCFIFTKEQIEKNSYLSLPALQFMIESLEELDEDLQKKGGQLALFLDKPESIVEKCIKVLGVDAIVVNRDYTPYSILRDTKIKQLCETLKIPFYSFDDTLLIPPEESLKSDGKPYTIFTPFFRNAIKFPIRMPQKNEKTNYYREPISFAESPKLYQKILPTRRNLAHGGRKAGLTLLDQLNNFSQYATLRDFPERNGTTHLSPHLKFNTCSSREVYHAIIKNLGVDSELIRSLYWRDFFTILGFFFPHVFQGAFQSKFDALSWSSDQTAFSAWCEGKTGFPIVDAGMRELSETGFMHNRVRMIAASFLIKDLHIHWQWGERYFAQHLIDYDPAVNNGNWQWVASTGADHQPYFRIFNPWTQQKKFDPEALYIKRWIPELKTLPAKIIHEWYLDKHHPLKSPYPTPIVDHAIESKIALTSYKSIK